MTENPAQQLAPPDAAGLAPWRSARLGAAALLAGLGLAGPRWGHEPAVVRGEGIDVVLALDASLSMMATDERPSRLERMKQEVRRYRAMAGADRTVPRAARTRETDPSAAVPSGSRAGVSTALCRAKTPGVGRLPGCLPMAA